MKFLDPWMSHTMTRSDAEQLATAYDKYDFGLGRHLCDIVLVEVFKKAITPGKTFVSENPDDLEGFIDLYLLADGAHLPATIKAANGFFATAFAASGQYGQMMFTEAHMKKLQSLVKEYNLLPACKVVEKMSLPTFPKDFVENAIQNEIRSQYESAAERAMRVAVTKIRLSEAWLGSRNVILLSRTSGDRFMTGSRGVAIDGDNYVLTIGFIGGNWAIYGRSHWGPRRVLWKCPHGSARKVLPPQIGWVPVDAAARGKPKIEYVYNDNDSE